MSRGKCILCRCEDVTLSEFRAAYREGFTEFESLKRYTGVGTGFCQGKGCLSESAAELASLRDCPPAHVRPTNIRPPAEPLTFAELAALDLPGFIGDAPAPPQPLDGNPHSAPPSPGDGSDPTPGSATRGDGEGATRGDGERDEVIDSEATTRNADREDPGAGKEPR
ncbi:MAG: (2Fe-2S)-binding protein [Candidatus Krumholzibacteriia bacterium]